MEIRCPPEAFPDLSEKSRILREFAGGAVDIQLHSGHVEIPLPGRFTESCHLCPASDRRRHQVRHLCRSNRKTNQYSRAGGSSSGNSPKTNHGLLGPGWFADDPSVD